MQNIRIKNAGNGGFLITEDHELYGTPIAALSNSDDLIDWLIKQFNLPAKNADEMIAAPEAISPQPPSEFFERKDTGNTDGYAKIIRKSPEPEQDGFITNEPEWIKWDASSNESPTFDDVAMLEVQLRNGGKFAWASNRLSWGEHNGSTIVRYRVLS